MQQEVVIVVPIYQKSLKPTETISLKRCLKVLGSYPIIFVKPASLSPIYLNDFIQNPVLENFDDEYFKSTMTYNKLMVSVDFYERFSSYNYMLIYQLDAYVFNDQLLEWCHKGFDYIGSPKLTTHEYRISKGRFSAKLDPRRFLMNGGLSLRKISAMIRFLKLYHQFYGPWPGNEDGLFSFRFYRSLPLRPLLKLPNWRTALAFGFEKNVEICYEINNQKLPFGCHAWEKYSPTFWRRFID